MNRPGPVDVRSEDPVERPIARVVIDSPLPHLDRPFDYAVPAAMAGTATAGARVKVRFAGQDLDAYVLERRDDTDHDGRLLPLRRVVSAEPVLTGQIARLARAVADRYVGTLSDVLRLAVPPRHATTEKSTQQRDRAPADPSRSPSGATGSEAPPPDHWAAYPAGGAFIGRLTAGEAPRAVWAALPGARHWAEAIVAACEPVLAAGRGAVVVVPDRRDVEVLERAVTDRFGPDRHARLEADLGPAARYRSFLACLRGDVRLAIGTRSAAFAPVHDLALLVIWDDGDESHVEPRAPYPHAREVLRLRAEQGGAAMLVGGWAVTAESAAWLRTGWARPIEADRTTRRRTWPRVLVEQDAAGPAAPPVSRTGLPSGAWRVLKRGLSTGPVLVQVPLTGYLPAVACQTCRTPARCPQCAGPVQVDAEGVISCGWCARRLVPWVCPSCDGTSLRARQTGALRSVEELGRSFPGVPVVLSRPGHTPHVGDRPAIVVATGGVEPSTEKGYAAAALLDGDLVLARPDLRAGEEALRRWLAAAALVRPAAEGGEVVVGADPAAPAVQALVRVDPTGFAHRELAQRSDLDLPPATATISLEGDPTAVAAVVRHVLAVESDEPHRVDVLGPIPLPVRRREPENLLDSGFELDPHPVRVLLRSEPGARAALAAAVRDAVRSRSTRREAGALRVRVDPVDLG